MKVTASFEWLLDNEISVVAFTKDFWEHLKKQHGQGVHEKRGSGPSDNGCGYLFLPGYLVGEPYREGTILTDLTEGQKAKLKQEAENRISSFVAGECLRLEAFGIKAITCEKGFDAVKAVRECREDADDKISFGSEKRGKRNRS